MPTRSTADLTEPIAFPGDAGVVLWQERRMVPVVAFYAAPLGFLIVGVIAVHTLVLRAVLAVALVIGSWLLLRAWRRALIEMYAVSERFVTIEQPGGGRVAIPTATIERVTVKGDRVQLTSSAGVVTLGFVRRQRALLRALATAAPDAAIEREVGARCPTCSIRY